MQYTHICKVDLSAQFEIVIGSVTDKGLETTMDMYIACTPLRSIGKILSRTRAGPDSRFVAATKAYRQLDDEWYDYSLRKAVELAGSDGSPHGRSCFRDS